jgi:hypothetical protein
MVEKKEGATMACKNCDTDLICRLKEYGGEYKPSLQWQNFDGSAHYKTKDGKNFNCNIPEDDEAAQTRISSSASPGDAPQMGAAELALLRGLDEKLETVLAEIQRVKEFVEPVFLKMVDDQIGRSS